MVTLEYRELTPKEQKSAADQKGKRTPSERVAYSLLPESMKKSAERNPPVAFKECVAYYPDLFFRKERICIELDGSSHYGKEQSDKEKDDVFEKRGFIVIRIKNEDTDVNVSFWQQLVKGLEKDGGNRPDILAFIDDLRKMIDIEIRSWTDLEYEYEILGEDTMTWQREYIAQKRKQWKIGSVMRKNTLLKNSIS